MATIELKSNERDGLVTRHRISDIAIGNTNGAETELLFQLPNSLEMASIDQVIFLMDKSSTGSSTIDVRIMDLDFVSPRFSDLVLDAAGPFSWADTQITTFRSGDDYTVQSPAFSTVSTVFQQNGIALNGGQLKLHYRSNMNVPSARLEFKEKTAGGLVLRSTVNINIQNTGGQEREIVINLPASGLAKIDEVLLVLSGGTGGALDMTVTDLDVRFDKPANILTNSASILTTGTRNVSASKVSGGYRIQSNTFFNSTTQFTQKVDGVQASGKTLRLRYKSNSAVPAVFDFKQQVPGGGGLATAYSTSPVQLANTNGAVREVLITLPKLLELKDIAAIAMVLTGTGSRFDLTVTGFDIY